MSNHLAIATVTAALKALVGRGIQAVPGAQVTSVRPDQIGQDGMTRGVNVFLFMATVNAALENQDTPLRREDGTAVDVPCTPLDLHYLLTFFGDETALEPQILLGSTLSAVRRQPVLTASLVREAVAGITTPDLSRSDLADQIPRVKVTPSRLDVDLLHKLWPTYQCPYLLSTAFQCSVVLVHSDVAPATARKPDHVIPTTTPRGS